MIRKALTELKLWGFQRMFTFVASTDKAAIGPAPAAGSKQAAGGRVPLIKEWSEVLSELGNHQSLVASLKTSQYYNMFKVWAETAKLQRCSSSAVLCGICVHQGGTGKLTLPTEQPLLPWSIYATHTLTAVSQQCFCGTNRSCKNCLKQSLT